MIEDKEGELKKYDAQIILKINISNYIETVKNNNNNYTCYQFIYNLNQDI